MAGDQVSMRFRVRISIIIEVDINKNRLFGDLCDINQK
jgi:hypothetical protein